MWRQLKTAFVALGFSVVSLNPLLAANMYNSYAPGAVPPGCDQDILNALIAAFASSPQSIAGILGSTGGPTPNGTGFVGSSGQAGVTPPAVIEQDIHLAMKLHGMPDDQYNDVTWIASQESSFQCGAANSTSSARGLFQLIGANAIYLPHGLASIGNCAEEAEGGIRYIQSRYGSAGNARAFWEAHHWY